MGIRFYCPNGHKLNVKEFQAGQNGVCPFCGAKMQIPTQSTRKSSKEERADMRQQGVELAVSDSRPPEMGMPITHNAAAEAAFTEPRIATAPIYPDPTAQQTSQPVPAEGQVLSAPAGPGGAIPGAPISTPGLAAPGPVTPNTPSPAEALPLAQAAPTPVDPLAEAGNSVWYVRPLSGGQFGPATADIMRSWLEEGRISSDSMVWCEGWPDWVGAVTIFPQLGPALAPKTATGKPGIMPVSDGPPPLSPARPGQRSRNKTTQAFTLTALILTVIVLVVIFWAVISLQ